MSIAARSAAALARVQKKYDAIRSELAAWQQEIIQFYQGTDKTFQTMKEK